MCTPWHAHTECYLVPSRHLAAAEGCYSVVEWLITEGKCVPNPIDRFKRTPLEVGFHVHASTEFMWTF